MDRLFANGLPSCARDHRSKDLSPRSVAGLGLAVMIDSNPEESHVTTPLRWPKMQRLLLAAGQAALLLAIGSPLDAFADLLLQAHMAQHWLLMMARHDAMT